MLKMFRYMKERWYYLVMILLLLFVQAFCDLSLPDYTSDIINVGIQQKGVEDGVPEKIREESMDRLFLFMDQEDRELVQTDYSLTDGVYELKDINEEERENFYSSSKALVQGWSNDEQKRKEAENARVEIEKQRVEAEKERATAESTRKESENTRIASENERIASENIRKANEETRQKQETDRQTNSATAVKNAEKATERLNNLADHRDEIRDGYWWRWNEETGEWYNTGEIAKGNVMFATFEVDPTTAILTMYTDEEYTGANFALDENGVLSVEI